MRNKNIFQDIKISSENLAKILKSGESGESGEPNKSGETEDFIKTLKTSPLAKFNRTAQKITSLHDSLAIRLAKEVDNAFQSLAIACVENKNLDALKAIESCGASLRFDNDFLLRWAASMGEKEILIYLLDSGSGSEQKQSMFAALRWAYEANHKTCSKILLQYSKVPDLKQFLDNLKDEGHEKIHHALALEIKTELNKKLVTNLSQSNTLEI